MYNKIGWCHQTLNPFVGCTWNCKFTMDGITKGCYAREQAKRQKHNCLQCYDFTPHVHAKRYSQLTPNQKPKRIFIGSMGDIADFVKWNGFMDRLNDVMRECKQHTFLIITKRPDSLYGITFPDNVWIGVTVCESTQMGRINELHYTHCSQKSNYFISFEPLIQFINWKNWENIYQKPRWVIIGGLSIGSGRYISPNWFWIDDILDVVDDAGHPIPVYMKDNVDFVGIRKEIPISMPTYENER